MNTPLMRLAEAARTFGISKTTLIRLRRAGKLRVFVTNGKQNMYYRDDIVAYLKNNSSPIINEHK